MKRFFLFNLFLSLHLICGLSKPVYYEDEIENQNQYDALAYLKSWVKHRRIDLALPADGEIFEGDMVMDARLRRAVKGVEFKRSALVGSNYKWDGGIIPYELHSSLVPKIRHGIKQAINQYERYTCIKFVPRNAEMDYVVFVSHPHKCSSNVGRQGGPQNITLGSGCSRLGTILHEMMHSIGIIHEQSRPDRDDHVLVIKENVDKKYFHNFEKYYYEDVTNLNVPYNYASLMHYSNNAFSRNGQRTLVARNYPRLEFGQRLMFSKGDVEQIQNLYDCKKSKSNKGLRSEHATRHKSLIPDFYDAFDHRLIQNVV